MGRFYVHSRLDRMVNGTSATTEQNYACYVEAESPGEALTKAAALCSGPTNGWEIVLECENEKFPPERFFNRNLTLKEVAEAKAVAYGQPWDPEAFEAEQKLRAEALEQLANLFTAGEDFSESN